jgi:hypothetical protein
MRSRFVALTLVSFLAAGTAQAQGGGAAAHPSCVGPAADACQQAVDFFSYMAPQLGTAMTGGNTTLAQGGSMGGMRFGIIPRFAVGVRVNAVQGNRPVYAPTLAPLAGASAPPPSARELATETQIVPLPAVDLALGVFKGIPLAMSNVGGVDLLLSASYVPAVGDRTTDDFALEVDESIAIGYGARIGILQESLIVPGVGISFMQRKFPTTTLFARTENAVGGATLEVQDLDLKSTAWRITASKSLLLFGLAAGVGQDSYKMSTSIRATQAPAAAVNAAVSSDVKRTNAFVDLSMNLLVLKLVGTVGYVTGGDITTYNSFDNAADKSRVYGSAGVRIGL